MAYTNLDIEAAIEKGFKPGKALADALATQAAYDAQQDGREAAEIRQKLATNATGKEAPDLLARLADIEVRKGKLDQLGLRRQLDGRVKKEWDAVRVGFADDYMFGKAAQFDAVNEAATAVPMALAQDITAALELPAEQAANAVRLHAAVKELGESVKTASRFGAVKTPSELQSRTTRILQLVKELAEWTDFSGSFKDAYELVQGLRRNVKSGSGMTIEDDPHPLFSPMGAVLVVNAGLKFQFRPVAERASAVQRVADDSKSWELKSDPNTWKPTLVPAAMAAEERRQAAAKAKRMEYLRAQAQAIGVDVNV